MQPALRKTFARVGEYSATSVYDMTGRADARHYIICKWLRMSFCSAGPNGEHDLRVHMPCKIISGHAWQANLSSNNCLVWFPSIPPCSGVSMSSCNIHWSCASCVQRSALRSPSRGASRSASRSVSRSASRGAAPHAQHFARRLVHIGLVVFSLAGKCIYTYPIARGLARPRCTLKQQHHALHNVVRSA